MNYEQLKNSILQEAIEGRLVPQDPNDEPASVLLDRIAAEKERLVKEKKIKRDKNESRIYRNDDGHWMERFFDKKRPEACIDDEIPFEIPDTWGIARLNNISFDSADGPFGSNLKREHYTERKEVRIIQLSNIGEEGWKDANTKYTTYEHLKLISRSEAYPGDIIIAKMMPAGRAIICPNTDNKYVLSSDAVRFEFSTSLYKKFLYYAINSIDFKIQVYGEVQGITRVRTSLNKLRTYLLPIPPYKEQIRIVEKIETILPKVEEYGKAQDRLDDLNAQLPEKLKASILQEAIEGRLVPQNPDDEPATVLLDKIEKEKTALIKAKKIKPDKNASRIYRTPDGRWFEHFTARKAPDIDITEEIPFEIPETWEWCRVGSIAFVTKLAGFEYTKYIAPNLKPSGIPLFKGKNVQNGQIIYNFESYISEELSDSLERSQINKPCLLTPYVGTIGNIGIHTRGGKYHLGSNVGKIEFQNPKDINCIEEKFAYYYLQSKRGYNELTKHKKATAQESISIEAIRDVLIPLPTISEQHRIVEKLEIILPKLKVLNR